VSDVAVLHWPQQASEAEQLAASGRPRLLLVAADADPPVSGDWLEEWVRLPADERDVAARLLSLTRRTASTTSGSHAPSVDASGRFLYRDQWVALSPTEARIAAALAIRFESVVGAAELGRSGWPDSRWGANALRVHMTRLRHRIEPLGLEIRGVRGQGFIMQSRPDRPGGIPHRAR
jgi:hypothetical protein